MPVDSITKSFFRERDREIFDVLTKKVAFLSLRQIADAFFAADTSNAIRRLDTLEERGFLASYRLNARTAPAITSPLVVWEPGQDQPHPTRIAFQLTKRWLRQGTQVRLCYFAGKKLEAVTGTPCQTKPSHQMQASHDLGLAALYLFFRTQRPDDAAIWVGEKAYTCFDGKTQRPDAVLLDAAGKPYKAIEFGGLYNSKRLDRFHRWCQQRSLPYELW